MRIFERKHQHVWQRVGYGGAGWFSIVCIRCGHRELEAA